MGNKKNLRSEKIADVLHKELANLIVKFCQDPRLVKLTITNVQISCDLSIAKIYFTNFHSDIKQVLQVLHKASSFFRGQLAKKISLRKIPELKFFYDENMTYGNKIEALLDKVCSKMNEV